MNFIIQSENLEYDRLIDSLVDLKEIQDIIAQLLQVKMKNGRNRRVFL